MVSLSQKLRFILNTLCFLIFLSPISFPFVFQANAAEEGLDVYYKLDTEKAVDESGNGRDGVIEGKPKLVDGVEGKAWQFDGTTAINMDFPIMTAPDPALSIRCFMKADDVRGQHVIYDEGGAWTGYCVRIMDDELQFATVCCDQNHPPPVIISAPFSDTKNWHELAAVYDHGKMALYLDGEKVGEEETKWKELGGHGQSGAIGDMSPGDTAFGPAGEHFVGSLDEFRIYSRGLVEKELKLQVSKRGNLAVTWGALKFRRTQL
ncbi:MAG: LamG domain-containing protein [Candidatus Poribacteria bacterium]